MTRLPADVWSATRTLSAPPSCAGGLSKMGQKGFFSTQDRTSLAITTATGACVC
jgi:hypothetical protein